jgi:hypothetical protein
MIVSMIGLSLLINRGNDRTSPLPVYTDPQYGFRISCPAPGWTISDSTGFSDVLLILKSNTIVDGFNPNITVTIEFLPHMLDAAQYAQRNLDCLIAEGFEVCDREKVLIQDNLFIEAHCIKRQPSLPLRFRYLCLVKDQIGYTITCVAPENHFNAFMDDFELAVNSFRFI